MSEPLRRPRHPCESETRVCRRAFDQIAEGKWTQVSQRILNRLLRKGLIVHRAGWSDGLANEQRPLTDDVIYEIPMVHVVAYEKWWASGLGQAGQKRRKA